MTERVKRGNRLDALFLFWDRCRICLPTANQTLLASDRALACSQGAHGSRASVRVPWTPKKKALKCYQHSGAFGEVNRGLPNHQCTSCLERTADVISSRCAGKPKPPSTFMRSWPWPTTDGEASLCAHTPGSGSAAGSLCVNTGALTRVRCSCLPDSSRTGIS